jgi:hypothetical protein
MLLLCSRQCLDADTVILDRHGRATRICNHPEAWPTGVRPVKRYTVRGGASLVMTDNHPVFDGKDWAAAGNLRKGDRIAVLTSWYCWEGRDRLEGLVDHGTGGRLRTVSVSFDVTTDLGKLIGYLMTDGSNRSGQSLKFTNTREEYLAEVESLALTVTGLAAKHYVKGTGADLLFTTTKARLDNRLMDLVRLLKWDHRFPVDLFSFPPEVAAAALNRAWSGDGCVCFPRTAGYPEISLACKNAIYGRYAQLLLMKFGIHSRLTTEKMKGAKKPFHRLVLGSGRLNTERFFHALGPIYGKEEPGEAALAYFRTTSKCPNYQRRSHRGEDGETFHLAPIVRIDDLGERSVYDITVPGKGWLVAQGLQVHNSGKSTVAAALAVRAALLEAPALVLLLSPTLRQSGELFRDKILTFYNRLGRPVRVTQESSLQMTLANGSRIISLPGDEETIRGYSGVRLLIVD